MDGLVRLLTDFHDGLLDLDPNCEFVAPGAGVVVRLRDIANHVFTFPPFVLESGFGVRVWTKAGANDAENLFWGRRATVWNNTGDTAILRDSSGNEIARFTYRPGVEN